MDKKTLNILEKFYKKLRVNFLREEYKLEKGSILLALVKMTSNKTSKLLNESSVRLKTFSENDLKLLESIKYIRNSDDEADELILTALGIWEVEKDICGMNELKILEFFQDRYFSFSKTGKPLTDKEKIIMLSMIGGRTFSEDSPMDINDSRRRDSWLEIFNLSNEFLFEHHLIKEKSLPFEKQGNEHAVAYAMRRANDLSKKTNRIYCSGSNKMQYYMNLEDAGSVSVKYLKNLFKLIFDRVTERELVDAICEYCNRIAYDKGKDVKENFKFIEPMVDEAIKEALNQLYFES